MTLNQNSLNLKTLKVRFDKYWEYYGEKTI